MGKKIMQPIILASGSVYSSAAVAALRKDNKIWKEVDLLAGQLAELFEIDNPDLLHKTDFLERQITYIQDQLGDTPELVGSWVYLPWNGQLIHMVGSADFNRLRTNRNQNLVTADEQAILASAHVGIAGLSVGNSIAIGLAQHGIGSLHISDDDTLETCNLNRLRAGVHQIGLAKQIVATQQLWELNPYLNLTTHGRLTTDDLDDFFAGNPVAVFDEIDDFEMKIRLRVAAQKHLTPVLMLTSLGDNVLIDVERYDLEPEAEVFHGLLGDLPEEILIQPITEDAKSRYAMDLVGAQYVPTRALASLMQIGRTLVGRPQLASAVIIDGGIATFLVRRLALGQDLPSGRFYLSLAEIMKVEDVDGDKRDDIIAMIRKGPQ